VRVLVVEDERSLADAIARGLRREGLAVDVAYDGSAGHEMALVTRYDVVVLDRDLPGVHGDQICADLVASGALTRVLMLTASGTVAERVEAELDREIVVEAGDDEMAVAGGNVCAVAQRRGVAGFIIDGVIRDVSESRATGFPLFAHGLSPIPGGKDGPGDIGVPVTCGGVLVNPGDVVVADEEGIVVVARARAEALLKEAQAKAAKDAAESLDSWERKHRARVESTLRARGYLG